MITDARTPCRLSWKANRVASLDLVLLGAAEFVLAGFAALLRGVPLILRGVLNSHSPFSVEVVETKTDILADGSRDDEHNDRPSSNSADTVLSPSNHHRPERKPGCLVPTVVVASSLARWLTAS